MALAARFSARTGRIGDADAARLIALLERLKLPVRPAAHFPLGMWLEYMGRDKKNEGGRITLDPARCAGRRRRGEGCASMPQLEAFLDSYWRAATRPAPRSRCASGRQSISFAACLSPRPSRPRCRCDTPAAAPAPSPASVPAPCRAASTQPSSAGPARPRREGARPRARASPALQVVHSEAESQQRARPFPMREAPRTARPDPCHSRYHGPHARACDRRAAYFHRR